MWRGESPSETRTPLANHLHVTFCLLFTQPHLARKAKFYDPARGSYGDVRLGIAGIAAVVFRAVSGWSKLLYEKKRKQPRETLEYARPGRRLKTLHPIYVCRANMCASLTLYRFPGETGMLELRACLEPSPISTPANLDSNSHASPRIHAYGRVNSCGSICFSLGDLCSMCVLHELYMTRVA